MGFLDALRMVERRAEMGAQVEQFAADTSQVETIIERARMDRLYSRMVRIPYSEAIQVPTFARCLNLYTGVIASFPLREYQSGTVMEVPRRFLEQPDAWASYYATMSRTVSDLVCYGQAAWLIEDVDTTDHPMRVRHIPWRDITVPPEDDPRRRPTTLFWMGEPARISYPLSKARRGEVIVFDAGDSGKLETAGSAIRLARDLEDATGRFAAQPGPQTVLKNTGADLPSEQVRALLDAWEASLQQRTTAYINSTLEIDSSGWDPQQLQMVEARNTAAIQVARAMGVAASWVDASVSGSSLTYQNLQDEYRQWLDLSAGPYMQAIAQRLSLNDVTPRGHTVNFDTSVFLRDNLAALADVVAKLQPLGVITVDEARDRIDLPPLEEPRA